MLRVSSRKAFPALDLSLRYRDLMSVLRQRRLISCSPTVSDGERKRFKDIQPHPTILNHIRSIGVGIKPRTTRKKRRNNFDLVAPGRGKRNSGTGADGSSTAWKPPAPFGPKSYPVKIVGTASSPSDTYPSNPKKMAEVALAGRSNVGKSTLLNALLYGNKKQSTSERKSVRGKVPATMKLPRGIKASMSSTPGETRQITFYQLEARLEREETFYDHGIRLVDLPGYGFAYASDQARKDFQDLMANYILNRGNELKRVLLLIDSRHGMKKADFEFLDNLQSRSRKLPPIQVVLTKSDLVTQTDLARRVTQVQDQLSNALVRETSRVPIMLVSARAGVGYNNVVKNHARGGVLQLQKELSSLVVARPRKAKKLEPK